MSIIERILHIAELKNIKQIEIAKAINKETSIITNWRKRNCNPPAEYIPAIAELLNVSIAYLMTGAEEGSTINHVEKELLDNFRQLNPSDQDEIQDIIKLKLERKSTKIINSKIG